MTPSQRAERVTETLYNQRKRTLARDKMDALKAIERNGPMTTAEMVVACRFANSASASKVLVQLRKDGKLARRESGEWVLT